MKRKNQKEQKSRFIVIASDHAGRSIKEKAELVLLDLKYSYEDLSITNKKDDDYPDFAKLVSEEVSSSKNKLGILVCGTGIGMSISANKFRGIRAALCHTKKEASLAREHNDANILVLPGKYSDAKVNVKEIVKAFLSSELKDKRNVRRVNKIKKLEN
ncbi:ribose-5-phosphate isomerase [Candidatus Woesearchaeota archaeon CG10_big_fil_rev_8_21_14_0_10_32_9]|nr:MAG: ribose-5-phosphate isomerase [Candidatus Woesearchaeota archaeon CG10_big_fil_rev_8_21_14_0_10_32_9]